ncbi:MAG: hypothetical protein BRD37_06985 [Bacteroidetes bacterium QH_8_67_23]|nr:MAG: hypothetical protein BRD37_06985 [Bacteroidetes bacterium QH_8_67_23]
MLPRSLTGTLFAAAVLLWWLLLGVLFVMLAPANEAALGVGFWIGAVLAGGAGFGAGAALGPPLARRLPTGRTASGIVRAAVGGAVLALAAGAAALLGGLLAGAVVSGGSATWEAARRVLTRPLLPAAVAFIGVPFGGAAGVVLRALATPAPSASPGDAP